ncbi:hypothetical protein FD05_GL000360 [Lentilactobacillus otakiensis DSM 19908 = JCM 15040]|uniref:Uncharacterized protein n=1 Tax=Lentilactobacillus otakiensis DSM 19908 = JCM 15040 TaxID=1423780 RepID=S4NQP4_9LACO|nr:hypothetical protein FD05_GL000360 [Lentilactobacillus otakiensis DSM 19908 = JCM 15040]GAD16343.1 hypothetical protein LOT_0881 [Lentilactobacillus otakiensis DSM 19908 = JCM 15040]
MKNATNVSNIFVCNFIFYQQLPYQIYSDNNTNELLQKCNKQFAMQLNVSQQLQQTV